MSSQVAIIEVEGRKLAFGMEWTTLKGVKREQDEVRELAKENKVSRFARSRSGGSEVLVGFPVGADESKLKGKVYSAAQAFASMSGIAQNAIFIWDFDNGYSWVCQVHDGMPMVGKDQYLESSLADIWAGDAISFTEGEITIYGNSRTRISTKKLQLADIAFASGKDDEIRRLSGFTMSMPMVIALMVGAAASYGGYLYYAEQQRIIEVKRKQAEEQKVDPNIRYDQELARLNPGLPAPARWAEVRQIVGAIPVAPGGWAMKSVDCDLKAANACTVTLLRDVGSNQDLLSQLNLPADTNWTVDANKVTYVLKLTAEDKANALSLEAAPEAKEFLMQFVSRIQDASLAGLDVSVKNLTPYGVPAGVAFNEISRDKLISAGEWQMSGDYWLNEFVDTLPQNFTISNVLVTADGNDIRFKMKGNYYAKN